MATADERSWHIFPPPRPPPSTTPSFWPFSTHPTQASDRGAATAVHVKRSLGVRAPPQPKSGGVWLRIATVTAPIAPHARGGRGERLWARASERTTHELGGGASRHCTVSVTLTACAE